MPMGNGMGPNGMGPRTGRGAGYCNGNNAPGAYNRGGRGAGMGRGAGFRGGFGGGAGYGNRGFGRNAGYAGNDFAANQALSEDLLREEAEFLEARLNAVREQLKNTEKESE